MQLYEKLFLEALAASLKNKKVTWQEPLALEIWQSLFVLAEKQKVLPLFFNAVYDSPAARQADSAFFSGLKRRSREMMILQVQKTAEFLELYRQLNVHSIYPLVVKGIVCRNLYPNPDLRVSADEDILVDESMFVKCVDMLKDLGMKKKNSGEDVENAEEISLIAEKGCSYIEVHKYLFSKDSKSYGHLNDHFADVFQDYEVLEIQGQTICTLKPQQHLFYLVCHALKHFLHSGFGLRQVCDIVMFANAYKLEIDWNTFWKKCGEIRAEKFTAAIFTIGEKYLDIPAASSHVMVDETALLQDLLDAGIYGGATMSRKHSSNMTLQAASENSAKTKSLKSSLFPPLSYMKGTYRYLEKYPFFLPVSWMMRIYRYWKNAKKRNEGGVWESVRIGEQRIELMKEYGII